MIFVLVLLSVSGFANHNEGMKQLKVTIPENLNYANVFDGIFEQCVDVCALTRAKTTNMGTST